MADRGGRRGSGEAPGATHADGSAELERLRRRIDALDRRIVALLNERAELGRAVGRAKLGAGRRDLRDTDREREVLLRASMANEGPLPQADLLSIYRRIIAATRSLEARDRAAARTAARSETTAPDPPAPGDGGR